MYIQQACTIAMFMIFGHMHTMGTTESLHWCHDDVTVTSHASSLDRLRQALGQDKWCLRMMHWPAHLGKMSISITGVPGRGPFYVTDIVGWPANQRQHLAIQASSVCTDMPEEQETSFAHAPRVAE